MQTRLRVFVLGGLLASAPIIVPAQTQPAPSRAAEETLVLDPFTVQADDTEGYRAQSSASGLPFVVALDKTPLPIAVITPEFLLDSASFTVEDALRFTSGISNAERNEYGTERYVIRGFQTNSTFVNGIRMAMPTDTSVIDRVEVLKGPSTILYGELDPAGLVNVITKRATFRNQTQLSQSWDEYGTARSTIDANYAAPKPFGPVRVAARMVATWADEHSYLPNESRERLILAPSLRLNLGKRTAVDVSFIRSDEDGATNRQPTPFFRNPADPTALQAGFTPVARDYTSVTPFDEWHLHSRFFDVQLKHEFSKSLHLLLSYDDSDVFVDQYFFFGTGNIAPTAAGQYRSSGKMTTQITQRSNEVYTAKLVYDLEFEAMEHKLALIARRTGTAGDQYGFQDSRDPVLGPYILADATGPLPVNFAGLPRRLTDPFSEFAVPILGNVRQQDFETQMNWTLGATDYVTLLSGRLNLLAGAQYNSIRGQDRDAVVPQVGGVYELRPGLNLYALYSETFAPNGRSDTTNPQSPFLEPEEGVGAEIGLKTRMFDEKLYGSIAAYQITRTNVEQILAGATGNVAGNSRNIRIPSGEERSEGIEADLQFRPARGFSVNLAYAYTDAYISEQNINLDNPDANGDGVADAVGQKKEGVAKHDIRVWTRYQFPDGSALGGLAIGGGFTWREGPIQQFGTYLQRKVLETSDPQRLDLFASYRTKLFERPVDFRANWQNATDEVYRDRRGKYVIPSTVVLSISARL